MPDSKLLGFGRIAVSLSRNPLGIIVLFIVLVYAISGLLFSMADNLGVIERSFFVGFLVLFPVFVLCVFTFLVVNHHTKLFGPSDYVNEDNFVKMQLSAAVSLANASASKDRKLSEIELDKIVNSVLDVNPSVTGGDSGESHRVLWVDDRPENNHFIRRAMEEVGLVFSISLNTKDALEQLKHSIFSLTISDMGRAEGPREGYALLDAMRESGDQTPLIFFAGSSSPEHREETIRHGGQGNTNDANELFNLVLKTVLSNRST